ncbi:MAG TPA: carbonic anhydrase [Stellaceae bacterium]|nr:carbonic anhydrase [Stellaceae bacterium]
MQNPDTGHPCACCGLAARPGRRGMLRGLAAASAILALPPRLALSASGKYDAMILACIDPRMHEPVRDFAVQHGLIGQYSQFTIAGAAIGVVAPAFAKWHQTFWENLAASIKLHSIDSIIAIDHRDCGAAKIAYGDESIATPEKENATHAAALAEFRKEVGQRHPALKVETLLMALDGSFISLG